jgi:TRAP-type C4-dicarboxylate transport system permease large subunit
MLIIYIAARLSPSIAPREVAPSWRVRLVGLLSLFPIFVLMFLVLGTIYLGVATPTEAAAFGVVGAFALAAINRQVNMKMLQDVLLTTVRTSSMIMLIVTAAFLLSFALSILGIPAQMAAWITSMELSPVTFVIILVGFYLVLGTFMEALSMMVTTVPILVPVLKSMGIDLVWFGIIMVILLKRPWSARRKVSTSTSSMASASR